MTYLASALFFTIVLLAALVAIHVTVQLSWREIMLALRGELGRGVTRPGSYSTSSSPRRRAAV